MSPITISSSPARTPRRSPLKRRKMAITLAQRQALIDNLQLEITERARKLRAQYAEQAHGLRTRLEMRISRVPKALRNMTMLELLSKCAGEKARPNRPAPAESLEASPPAKGLDMKRAVLPYNNDLQPSHRRGTKRSSDDLQSNEDIENAIQGDIVNPKKRAKTTAKPVASNTVTSKAKVPSNQVLSPKSLNSRTLPRSPVRPGASPAKSFLARPVSPLKQSSMPTTTSATVSTLMEKAKTKRTTTVKKIAAAASTVGASKTKRVNTTKSEAAEKKDRDASNSSSSTVRGGAMPKRNATSVTKKVTTASAANRKAAVTTDSAAGGRRTLRKRT